ncbi:hypothetical protein DFQ30_009249 [Apophysomyces sp. BC1015]|nr:hypothetical protein DFQ30_009249 [Apophysomyces sp. BC1015]
MQSARSIHSNDGDERKKEMLGLLLMLLSAFAFSIMSMFVKICSANFPSFQIVFARSIVQLFLGLMGCAAININPLGKRDLRGLLVTRGMVGAISLALFYYSITQLPLPDATVVYFLGPTFTAILAAMVLHEKFTIFDGMCSAGCLAGVILVSKPQFLFGHGLGLEGSEMTRLLAVGAALLGALSSAVVFVIVRKIGKGAHFMVHVVYFGAMALVLSLVGMLAFQEVVVPTTAYDYGMLLLVGIFAFIGQCLCNSGLQLAPAGPGTLMRMNDVVFAFLLSIGILHEYPDLYSILGACLILWDYTSGILVPVEQTTQPIDDPFHKRSF